MVMLSFTQKIILHYSFIQLYKNLVIKLYEYLRGFDHGEVQSKLITSN